jgi:hypothetical protein
VEELRQIMQNHREWRNGVEYPSEAAKREASDFFEQKLQRTARSDFADCLALAKRFDDFRQQGCPTVTRATNIATDQPAIRDVLHAPIIPGAQQVSVPVYTTDAPYPASNAEIQMYRHGQDKASPCTVHLVSTTWHFTSQQGGKWVTELLRNWRRWKGNPITVKHLELLDFLVRHRHTAETAAL